ncbi:hypothetical protein EYF80_052706 [Liparis tanakae]|uniref:Uncharacterized protein n=1 Tax=Liparis tanakae TaxID=230148 RepID=A0A4Z2F8B5_9TELE|nr:hypothetical protein EYF80_052706 [Liparis tanakae]
MTSCDIILILIIIIIIIIIGGFGHSRWTGRPPRWGSGGEPHGRNENNVEEGRLNVWLSVPNFNIWAPRSVELIGIDARERIKYLK